MASLFQPIGVDFAWPLFCQWEEGACEVILLCKETMPKEMDILQIYMSNYLLWHSLKFLILLVLNKFKSSKIFLQVNYFIMGVVN